MSTAELAVPAQPAPQPPDLFWMQLLSLMQERKVIPIVGHDAIVVTGDDGRPCTLNEYLARRVAVPLGVAVPPPGERTTLNQVVCRYLERRDAQVNRVYSAVKFALSTPPVPVPDALRKLAGIDAFHLYVSTTFDNLLQRAIDDVRFGGERTTGWYAYTPDRPDDLPGGVAELENPAVYHLLGRVSALPDYVVTEEDTLEFVHALQSENRRPNTLVDELRSHSILLIGSGYSDWLMRFFLRIAKRDRLLVALSRAEFVADERNRDDPGLREFLRTFTPQTQVFEGGALDFIDELARRWDELRSSGLDDERPRESAPARAAAPSAGPVFVSYASDDRDRAEKVVAALKRRRVPVWYDREGGLDGGADYQDEIRESIRECLFFAPLLSRSVLTPDDRFFREEWDIAIRRSVRVNRTRRYILPLRLDDAVDPDDREIPEEFGALQWTSARNDAEIEKAADYIQKLYRDHQRELGARR